jgi:hypothetical protein
VLRYYVVDFIICFGVVAANGVVIATEKKLPSILVDESSVSKHLLFLFSFYWFCYILWLKFKNPFVFLRFFVCFLCELFGLAM